MSSVLNPRARPSLSVAMIARNEEENLARTLTSVGWADEIMIVDSGSVDRTPEIARSFGAHHFFNRDFHGYGAQKALAIGKCTGDWVLLLDADEVVTPELGREIRETIRQPRFEAYSVPRRNLFMGSWIRHGGFYPDRKLRLWRRGAAHMQIDVEPHATPQYDGPVGKLRHDLMHYAYPRFDLYLNHMNSYSSASAGALAERDRAASLTGFFLLALLNPAATFLKNYFLRLGFLDGLPGLIYHLNHSVYVHWKYVKAWEARRAK